MPGATHEAVLALSVTEQRILITRDKDFGELVFQRGLPYMCVIRVVGMHRDEEVSAVVSLLERHAEDIRDQTFITVLRETTTTGQRARFRLRQQ